MSYDYTSVAITIGNGYQLGLTNNNHLVVEDRINGERIDLGKFTKARAKELSEYLDRLAIHVE